MDDDADAKMILTAPPPENWKRPPGRPRITWLNTIQRDLRACNLTLNEAVDLAQNRPLACTTLSGACQKKRRMRSADARKLKNKNSTRHQRLRRLQRSRLELSAGRTPSFIADCCNVCQALENSLVFVPEVAHLRTFLLCAIQMCSLLLLFIYLFLSHC